MNTAISFVRRILEHMEGPREIHAYSGRAMYGKTCFAIAGTWADCQRVIAEAIKLNATEVYDQARDFDPEPVMSLSGDDIDVADESHSMMLNNIDALLQFSTDNLGHDIVMYWPAIEYVAPSEKE